MNELRISMEDIQIWLNSDFKQAIETKNRVGYIFRVLAKVAGDLNQRSGRRGMDSTRGLSNMASLVGEDEMPFFNGNEFSY